MNPETVASVMSATNPWPYILAAYIGGLVLAGGYTVWAIKEKQRLHTMLRALREGKNTP
jgi:hypothetical protein